MTKLLVYFIETSVCLTTFWMIYWLFLKSETFFRLNRIYLQATLLLSFLIPFVSIGIQMSERIPLNKGVIMFQEVVVYAYNVKASSINYIEPFNWFVVIIFVGSIIGLFIFIRSLLKLNKLVKHSKLLQINGISVVASKYIQSTFVFRNRIFIPFDMLEDNDLEYIIQHELVHINQKHSFDNMIMTIILLIMWFNPFAWLYRESFREIHEFIADSEVMKKGIDTQDYKISVLKSIIAPGYKYINYFNVSFIKKRLIMMSKIKSPKKNIVKIAILVPVLSLLVLVFSCEPKIDTVQSKNEPSISKSAINTNSKTFVKDSSTDTSENVFSEVADMPIYTNGSKKGNNAFRDDLNKYVKYPESAKKAGVSAKVFVSFVISKSGKVKNVVVKKVRVKEGNCSDSVKSDLENSAIKAVKMLKNWVPGKKRGQSVDVNMIVPINYKLE